MLDEDLSNSTIVAPEAAFRGDRLPIPDFASVPDFLFAHGRTQDSKLTLKLQGQSDSALDYNEILIFTAHIWLGVANGRVRLRESSSDAYLLEVQCVFIPFHRVHLLIVLVSSITILYSLDKY